MWSSPAWARRSSSLPNALTENGQVGSRNTSKTRGPWPQTSGSARHVFFIRSFPPFRLVHKRRRPEGGQTLRAGKPGHPDEPEWTPAAELFRCTNAGHFLERLFERCIQEAETEIDFGFGGRQRRCNTHHPVGSAGAHNVGAQSETQRPVCNRIRKSARRVVFVSIERSEFHSEQQTPPAHVANTGISLLQ